MKNTPTSKPITTHKIKKPIKNIHKEKSETFLCELCSHKTFISKNKLESHQKVIHSEKPDYVCSVCGKCMKRKYILKDHELLHMGDRSFVCKTCGKTFSTLGNLRVHQRIVHDKVKRFCCHICGYRSFGGSEFKTHLRRHNLERTHLCPKALFTNHHLKRHVLTHGKHRKPRGPNKKKEFSKQSDCSGTDS